MPCSGSIPAEMVTNKLYNLSLNIAILVNCIMQKTKHSMLRFVHDQCRHNYIITICEKKLQLGKPHSCEILLTNEWWMNDGFTSDMKKAFHAPWFHSKSVQSRSRHKCMACDPNVWISCDFHRSKLINCDEFAWCCDTKVHHQTRGQQQDVNAELEEGLWKTRAAALHVRQIMLRKWSPCLGRTQQSMFVNSERLCQSNNLLCAEGSVKKKFHSYWVTLWKPDDQKAPILPSLGTKKVLAMHVCLC